MSLSARTVPGNWQAMDEVARCPVRTRVHAVVWVNYDAVDMANYYTAEIQRFGLFNFKGVPQEAFYAFKAFRELLETPQRGAQAAESDRLQALPIADVRER